MNLTEYHRPFSAGPFAQIYPGSLVVEFNLTREQILDLNAGNRLLTAIGQADEADRRERTFADVPDDAKQFLAVRAHEQDHLRRSLSTTFGFLCDTVRNQWVTLAARVVAESARESRDRLAPLPIPFVPGRGHFAGVLSSIRQRADDGFRLDTLFRGNHDLLEALIDDATPGEFASALWGLTNGNAEAVAPLTAGIDVERDLCSAHPMADTAGRTSGLTARHILELFAIGEHGNGLLRTGTELSVVENLLKESSHEYATTLLAWRSVFPDAGWPDVAAQARREDDLIIEWYRLFPFELYVAADLALWPPFFPTEALAVDGELAWADVQPGRRFVKVLAAFQALRVQPSVIPADRRDERFLDLQSRVCDHLGRPTPHHLATEWATTLSLHARAETTLWPSLDGPVNYRVANAHRLLTARLDRPADFVLNNIDFHGIGLDGVPGWVFREADDRLSVVAMSRLRETALVPLVMIEGTRGLASNYSRFFDARFDATFRKTAVGVLSDMLARAGGWDDTTRARFRDEAGRHFRIARD